MTSLRLTSGKTPCYIWIIRDSSRYLMEFPHRLDFYTFELGHGCLVPCGSTPFRDMKCSFLCECLLAFPLFGSGASPISSNIMQCCECMCSSWKAELDFLNPFFQFLSNLERPCQMTQQPTMTTVTNEKTETETWQATAFWLRFYAFGGLCIQHVCFKIGMHVHTTLRSVRFSCVLFWCSNSSDMRRTHIVWALKSSVPHLVDGR